MTTISGVGTTITPAIQSVLDLRLVGSRRHHAAKSVDVIADRGQRLIEFVRQG